MIPYYLKYNQMLSDSPDVHSGAIFNLLGAKNHLLEKNYLQIKGIVLQWP